MRGQKQPKKYPRKLGKQAKETVTVLKALWKRYGTPLSEIPKGKNKKNQTNCERKNARDFPRAEGHCAPSKSTARNIKISRQQKRRERPKISQRNTRQSWILNQNSNDSDVPKRGI